MLTPLPMLTLGEVDFPRSRLGCEGGQAREMQDKYGCWGTWRLGYIIDAKVGRHGGCCMAWV